MTTITPQRSHRSGRSLDPGAGPGPHRRERRPRVALYSHDALGLGHVRRNLVIARALGGLDSQPDVLLLTGAPETVAGDLPARCDLVSLPALTKDATGRYGPRHLSVTEEHIADMRRAVLTAALVSFRPDVLVVDKHPRGFRGELEPALDVLRETGTRIVLGLRDVLDDEITARREWQADHSVEALERWYHQLWVYGDRRVQDLAAQLRLPARLASRTVHTGYLATGRIPASRPPRTEVRRPYVLAMVGGGSDGAQLAEAFARAELPAGHHGLLVTGPQMPAADVHRVRELAATRDDLTVRDYVPDPEALLADAAAVVSMGGYNTVCEAMTTRARLLVVPRVVPRTEQLVRAELLRAAGMLDLLVPGDLTPAALTDWLTRAVTAPPAAPVRPAVDLDGLARLPRLLTTLLATKENVDVA